MLGYAKFNDQWQLVIRDETKSAENPLPLLKASRALRLAAMDHIPRLLSEIESEIKKLLGAIDRAEKAAQNL